MTGIRWLTSIIMLLVALVVIMSGNTTRDYLCAILLVLCALWVRP